MGENFSIKRVAPLVWGMFIMDRRTILGAVVGLTIYLLFSEQYYAGAIMGAVFMGINTQISWLKNTKEKTYSFQLLLPVKLSEMFVAKDIYTLLVMIIFCACSFLLKLILGDMTEFDLFNWILNPLIILAALASAKLASLKFSKPSKDAVIKDWYFIGMVALSMLCLLLAVYLPLSLNIDDKQMAELIFLGAIFIVLVISNLCAWFKFKKIHYELS